MTEFEGPQQKWNARYLSCTAGSSIPGPAQVLMQFQHLLPPKGIALELACGLGGNALFLARLGFKTFARDISKVAIERLRKTAQANNLTIHAEVNDLSCGSLEANQFDVIVVSRYLDHTLFPKIIDALKPQGLVFYQTFIREKVAAIGPDNPAYLLEENELLRSFIGLRILVYREEGSVGDIQQGFRNEAMIVAQKKPR